ncbi:MAG: ATP-dependent DNA helicase [Patescibacteria group bacterium]
MSKQVGDELFKDLNVEQREAVTHGAGPLLIVAGAGTGKTTVITKRVAWLIEQKLAEPEQILALTFTDKAATEMEERVDKLLPMGYVNTWISTFHSFGERILKDYALEIGLPNDFRVLTQTEQWMLVRHNLDRFKLDYYRPLGNPTKFIHALIQHFSRAKDEAVWSEDYLKYAEDKKLDTGAGEFLKKGKVKSKSKSKSKSKKIGGDNEIDEAESARLLEVAEAYNTYQKLLLEQGALDFGDLINYTLKLLQRRPKILQRLQEQFKYILVDEFQDTNYAQYELIKLLAAPANNLAVVGDDDQSVYKFRGASISNILEFKRDYPKAKEVFLTTNYRSQQNILDTAYEFIQLNNPYRLEVKLAKQGKSLSKKLMAARAGLGEIGYKCYGTADAEAEAVIDKIVSLQSQTNGSWSDFAILVRANSSALLFLQALKKRQLPFDYVANRGLYSEPIILDIINYLKLLSNYHESAALYRVLAMEPFLLPAGDIAALAYYANRKTISLFEAVKLARTVGVSEAGLKIIERLLTLLDKHTSMARQRSVGEVYVQLVQDLGINERVSHPALMRDASYLNTFYQRLQRFENESSEHNLNRFMDYLALELESGEEGQLPQNYDEGPETVKVITVHSAKGLEWKYVFLVQLIDRRFPSTERRDPIELPRELIKEILPEGDVHLQEERRLFYVAMTRARDGLYLSRAEDYFGKTTRKPSRFLYELGLVSEVEKSKPLQKIINSPAVIKNVSLVYPLPDTYSFSSVSAFRKCPLEYKYRYLLKLPMPGAGNMSFGITIHRTLEQFLKLWQARLRSQQGSLFVQPTKNSLTAAPTWEELMNFYKTAWLDDWYADASDKEKYKKIRGPKQLKNFYQEFTARPPQSKYIEQFFKIALGQYKFVGKIDRLDQVEGGLGIIDYKTGNEPRKGLEKVDKDQLIIYQIAAEEFLRERVTKAQYWYLEPNQFSEAFLATPVEIAKLKAEYIKDITSIIQTIESNSFLQAHEQTRQHDCKFLELE